MTEATDSGHRLQAGSRYPSCVMTHRRDLVNRRQLRGPIRAGIVAAALGVLAVVLMSSGPAMADTPAAWETPPHVSGLQFLIVLFLIPLGLAVVIGVLAALPSLISGDKKPSGQAWRTESEWFGGPRKGVEAADAVTTQQLDAAGEDRGGASARW
ncbi:MAG: hypothetical protein JWR35_989 [Marmoricola sp.]|nr:hypothetical protein [Marmoricola sp.]